MHTEKTDFLEYRYDFLVEDFNALLKYSRNHLPDGKPKPRTSPIVWGWLVIMLCTPLFMMAIKWYAGEPVVVVREAPAEPPKPVGPLQGMLSFVIVLAIPLWLLLVILLRVQRWRQRRAIRAGVGYKNQTCTLSADGIVVNNGLSVTHFYWEMVSRVVFAKQQILFYVGRKQVVVLPRRAVESTDELVRISACLRKWYSGTVLDEQGKEVTAQSALLLE